MNIKQCLYSLTIAIIVFITIHLIVDLMRFNITLQRIYDGMITNGATQFNEYYTVKAYVVEHDNSSTIYVYIKSAITNRYRRYIRFENEGNLHLNGGVISVIGASNFVTHRRGSHYYVTMRDDTFWFQESLGDYTLQINMIRRHGFSFRLVYRTVFFVSIMTVNVYRLFNRRKARKMKKLMTVL
ncbi:MAG: hypothetical protein FWC92_04735 [Defluviitaleaceae bacterium]|nr:hypothetical protein [Defluviitaleaceae bacterium]